MNLLKNLAPADLGYWMIPIIWINIVITTLNILGYIKPDYGRLNFIFILSYFSCIVSSIFRSR